MNTLRLSLVACLAASPLVAQQTRDPGAHQHGVSTLDIAVEGSTVAMALLSPGADIVGFEHPASSDADRDAVETAIRTLLLPETVVALPEAAECRLTEGLARLDAGASEAGGEHGHDDPAHDGDGHSEFHARYLFDCAHPEALTTLAFPFFAHFPHAQEIEARYVTAAGAGSAEIPRDAAELTLD